MQDPRFLEIGREQYEFFTSKIDKKRRVQYDYRHLNGELFSCITKDLNEAREKRNKWMSEQKR